MMKDSVNQNTNTNVIESFPTLAFMETFWWRVGVVTFPTAWQQTGISVFVSRTNRTIIQLKTLQEWHNSVFPDCTGMNGCSKPHRDLQKGRFLLSVFRTYNWPIFTLKECRLLEQHSTNAAIWMNHFPFHRRRKLLTTIAFCERMEEKNAKLWV